MPKEKKTLPPIRGEYFLFIRLSRLNWTYRSLGIYPGYVPAYSTAVSSVKRLGIPRESFAKDADRNAP